MRRGEAETDGSGTRWNPIQSGYSLGRSGPGVGSQRSQPRLRGLVRRKDRLGAGGGPPGKWGSVRRELRVGKGWAQGCTELRGGGLSGGGRALAQGRVALFQGPLAHRAVGDTGAGLVSLLVLHQDAAHQVLRAGQGDAWGQLVGTDRSGPAGESSPPPPCPATAPSPPTGYLSSGSMSSASPKMDRQYSAILACCFALRGQG